ncbi:hypothetical protein E3N88_25083 [Mikania micrantha]|uniref:Uncharacterized protein n=1 Tax=Mikania micrantha TaxID=192012 RepID=A0A5N6N3R0_9ASTR|nr:hypothetical protein E3N88_25083 [Mikania micrantha]
MNLDKAQLSTHKRVVFNFQGIVHSLQQCQTSKDPPSNVVVQHLLEGKKGLETSQIDSVVASPVKPEGMNNIRRFGGYIPSIFHCYVSNIQDVMTDGNCGFRFDIIPAPQEHWLLMPYTGLVVAQRFGVIVHLINQEGCITFFPLWLALSTIPQHNVVCLLHKPMHFVNLRLEGDYPFPTLSAVWKRYRNDVAGEGEDLRGVYVTRIARFNGLIDLELAGMEVVHPVRLDRRTILCGRWGREKSPQLKSQIGVGVARKHYASKATSH